MPNDKQPTVQLSFRPGYEPATAPPALPDSYLVLFENRQYGPASSATIREWIADFRISRDAMVQQVGTNQWKCIAGLPEVLAEQITSPNVPVADMTRQLSQTIEKLSEVVAAMPDLDLGKDTLGYLVPMIEHAIQASPLSPAQKQQVLNIIQMPCALANDEKGNFRMGEGVCASRLLETVNQYGLEPKQAAQYLFANIQDWGSLVRTHHSIKSIKTNPDEFVSGQVDDQMQLVTGAWSDPDVLAIANFVLTRLLLLKHSPPNPPRSGE